MNESDLCFLSAAERAQAIAAKRVSPVDVVEAASRRIERLDPKLNAYCSAGGLPIGLQRPPARRRRRAARLRGLRERAPVERSAPRDLTELP